MAFSDRANSTVLRNRHCANCDPRRDLSYRFSTPRRFYTTTTQGRRSCIAANYPSFRSLSVAIDESTRVDSLERPWSALPAANSGHQLIHLFACSSTVHVSGYTIDCLCQRLHHTAAESVCLSQCLLGGRHEKDEHDGSDSNWSGHTRRSAYFASSIPRKRCITVRGQCLRRDRAPPKGV